MSQFPHKRKTSDDKKTGTAQETALPILRAMVSTETRHGEILRGKVPGVLQSKGRVMREADDLSDLRELSKADDRYVQLTIEAARNFGMPCDTLATAFKSLDTVAHATDEPRTMDEVNSLITIMGFDEKLDD